MSSQKTNTDQHAAEHDKLRVLFVTEDDPLYVIEFFKVFFKFFPDNDGPARGMDGDFFMKGFVIDSIADIFDSTSGEDPGKRAMYLINK